MPYKKRFLFLMILLGCQMVLSQEKGPKKDSSAVYKNIQTYSSKHKFTKVMHKLIFRPVNSQKKKYENEEGVQQNYQQFEGKIIRKINIVTLDPFGLSEKDSTKMPRNWAERTGNGIHAKTKKFAIRNALVIKENKPLDSLLVKESERLIRAQSFVNRVAITTQLTAKNSDSVDVFIRVLDTWSLLPRASVSSSKSSFQLNERNFLGTGHTFNTRYQQTYGDSRNGYNFEYIVPNFKNTFIQTRLKYLKDLDGNYGKSIGIERPFYSPYTKWAGGITMDQQFKKDSLSNANMEYARLGFRYNSQDLWVGRAFKISEDNTENSRVTNLIVTGRFLNVNYIDSPPIEFDPIDFYSSETFFLYGVGLSTRKFVQDKYIFKNGVTEDIPIGKTFGITGGYQVKNGQGRYYFGGQSSFGNYFKWGFLSLNFELGTFFNQSISEQTAFTFQTNYFTNLLNIGKWKLRQFVKPQLIIGIHRQNSVGDLLSINDNFGIKGFKSAIYGTQKAMLTLQTQSYSPWNLFGFRLNPFFNYELAMLGNENKGLSWSGKLYSKIGIGMLITNDYLVFRTLQISIAYYPSIPGDGTNVLKTNTFETTDFGVQDFGLEKPRTVIYK